MKQFSIYADRNSRCAQSNVYSCKLTEQGAPGLPPSGVQFFHYTSDDFTTFIQLQDVNLLNLQYAIYWNEAGRYLDFDAGEYEYLSDGGFQINVPDFSATSQGYNFFLTTLSAPGSGTGPIEPITLVQAKEWCRVAFDDDDVILSRLITQSRRAIELYCSLSLVQKNIKCLIDLITPLELPYGPILSFISLKDRSGNIVDPTLYDIDGIDFLYVSSDAIRLEKAIIEYTAGPETTIDPDLQEAILNEVSFRYDNRGDETNRYAHQSIGICAGAEALAQPFKRLTWQ